MGAVVTPVLLPQCGRPLRTVMLERLMDAGTWLHRDELSEGLSSSPPAIEDALADLVIDGQAEFRQNVGYRLAGTVLVRRAVKLMRTQKSRRGVASQEFNGHYRVGVAEMHGMDLVVYELTMPMPEAGEGYLAQHGRQIAAVFDLATREG